MSYSRITAWKSLSPHLVLKHLPMFHDRTCSASWPRLFTLLATWGFDPATVRSYPLLVFSGWLPVEFWLKSIGTISSEGSDHWSSLGLYSSPFTYKRSRTSLTCPSKTDPWLVWDHGADRTFPLDTVYIAWTVNPTEPVLSPEPDSDPLGRGRGRIRVGIGHCWNDRSGECSRILCLYVCYVSSSFAKKHLSLWYMSSFLFSPSKFSKIKFIGFQRCTKIHINTDSLPFHPSIPPSLYPFFSQNCLHILSKVFRSTAKQPTLEVGSIRCGSSRIQWSY